MRPEVSALCGHFACQAYRRLSMVWQPVFPPQEIHPNSQRLHLEVSVLTYVDAWHLHRHILGGLHQVLMPSLIWPNMTIEMIAIMCDWNYHVFTVHSSSRPFRTSYYDVLTVEIKSSSGFFEEIDSKCFRHAGASGSWKNWSAQFAVARQGVFIQISPDHRQKPLSFEAGRCEVKT